METEKRVMGRAEARRKYADTPIRSFVIAVVLLLHLSMLCWLTLPVPPLQQSFKAIDHDMAMEVHLIEAQHTIVRSMPAGARLPPPSPQTPRVQRKVVRGFHPVAAESPSNFPPNAPLPMRSEPISPNVPPSESDVVPYGNSRFNQSLQSGLASGPPHIPGEGEPVRVAAIHVDSAPSVSQILDDVGHALRCKDALFKSRMANDRGDAQLAQRGMTYQQAMMEWSELNCH